MDQPTPAAPGPAPSLSAGTLFYLYGDQVLPAAGVLGSNVELPYSGVKVSAVDLSALAFAVSMWRLRQEGSLLLAPTTSKALGLISQPDVALSFGPNLGPRSGYEDIVMRGVSQGRDRASSLVEAWFGHDVPSPEATALGVARQEVVQHGLGREVDAGRGAVAGMFLGKTSLQLDLDRVREQWGPFWQLHQGWQGFRQTEQPLADALFEACRRAIRGRERRDRDDF